LNRALELLGFPSVHWPTTRELLYGRLQAATDEQVSIVYKFLDFRWPGSKFILTERDEDSWIASTAAHRKHFVGDFANKMADWRKRTPEPSRESSAESVRAFAQLLDDSPVERDRTVELILTQMSLYETVDFDEAKFRAGYRRFHADVARYFADRPNDLLRIRICDGEGWEKLAPFLGKPIPGAPFPHEYARAVLK
jgi:hypothetical protein